MVTGRGRWMGWQGTAFWAFLACSPTVELADAPRGNSGGAESGNAGQAGSAGASAGGQPAGGRPGGGQPAAGASGRGGAAGDDELGGAAGDDSGGSAGSGGGTSGAPNGGTSGSGNACGQGGEPPALDFSRCALGPFWHDGGESNCSLADTKRELGCGVPASAFDADCCWRTECRNDGDCPSGGRCIARHAQGPTRCSNTHYEGCQFDCTNARCRCLGASDTCDNLAYCIGPDEPIAEFDCNIESETCTSSEWTFDGWLEWLVELAPPGSISRLEYDPPVHEHVLGCIEKICTERRCNQVMDDRCQDYGF